METILKTKKSEVKKVPENIHRFFFLCLDDGDGDELRLCGDFLLRFDFFDDDVDGVRDRFFVLEFLSRSDFEFNEEVLADIANEASFDFRLSLSCL